MGADQPDPILTGPTGRVLGVLDDPGDAGVLRAALAEGGVASEDVDILEGAEAADLFDASGEKRGPIAFLIRALQYTLADQIVDVAYYQAALRSGRAVVSIRADDRPAAVRAVKVLRAQRVHFVNRFGRGFETEEFIAWYGPEPDVAPLFQR